MRRKALPRLPVSRAARPPRVSAPPPGEPRRALAVSLYLILLASFALSLAGCGAVAGSGAAIPLTLSGTVHGGQQPVANSTIQLYAVGTGGDGSAATPLLATRVTTSNGTGNAADPNANAGNAFNALPAGSFVITGDYQCTSSATQVYLTASGGNPGLAPGRANRALSLMAVLGPCGSLSPSTHIVINELTTVGSIAPLRNFMSSYAAIGSGPTDAAQFAAALAAVPEYVDTSRGTVPGPALPPASYASSVELKTLADVLAGCVNSDGGTAGDSTVCGTLFRLATTPGSAPPTDTIGAALNILKYPTRNVAGIYNLIAPSPAFQPALSASPQNWALPILPGHPALALPVTGTPPTTYSPALNDTTIFIGASIIHYWPMPLHDAGISGQTTPQILQRFQADVLGHGYLRVVILAGTNDILGGLPGFPDEATANLAAMASIAREAGMEVVLSELPPLVPSGVDWNAQVRAYNAQIAALAASNGYLVVDYFTPMLGHPELFNPDGIHPNAAGYAVMERALSAVVLN